MKDKHPLNLDLIIILLTVTILGSFFRINKNSDQTMLQANTTQAEINEDISDESINHYSDFEIEVFNEENSFPEPIINCITKDSEKNLIVTQDHHVFKYKNNEFLEIDIKPYLDHIEKWSEENNSFYKYGEVTLDCYHEDNNEKIIIASPQITDAILRDDNGKITVIENIENESFFNTHTIFKDQSNIIWIIPQYVSGSIFRYIDSKWEIFQNQDIFKLFNEYDFIKLAGYDEINNEIYFQLKKENYADYEIWTFSENNWQQKNIEREGITYDLGNIDINNQNIFSASYEMINIYEKELFRPIKGIEINEDAEEIIVDKNDIIWVLTKEDMDEPNNSLIQIKIKPGKLPEIIVPNLPEGIINCGASTIYLSGINTFGALDLNQDKTMNCLAESIYINECSPVQGIIVDDDGNNLIEIFPEEDACLIKYTILTSKRVNEKDLYMTCPLPMSISELNEIKKDLKKEQEKFGQEMEGLFLWMGIELMKKPEETRCTGSIVDYVRQR